jgi:hypothetical protein
MTALILSIPENTNIALVDDSDFASLASAGDWLGRLKLYTKGKPIDKGLIRGGHFGIGDEDDITDLGEEVDLLPLARRAQAIDMSDSDAIVRSYDPKTETFQNIVKLADESGENGCVYGISFLVIERTTGQFLEFFFSNKSARREAGKVFPFLPSAERPTPVPMTVKSKLIETKKYSWHAPSVSKCSTPFENLPSVDSIMDQIAKFVNPQASETVEKVEVSGRVR